MTDKVLFSIIVPIYKVEQYLRQCVDSLINQNYENIEVVLVDDGSPDNCPTICDEYARVDNRVKVIHKENGGLVSARKAGAVVAMGDYICCVDGDDWVDRDYISKFADAVHSYNPDIVASGYKLAFKDRCEERVLPNRSGVYNRHEMETEIFPNLIQNKNAGYFSPSVWGKAFRRELYVPIQCAVDSRIKIGEDGACTIPCVYNAESMVVLTNCSYYYRQNEKSMTKAGKAFDWRGPELIHCFLEQQINMALFDFKEQLFRKTAHEVFTVVLSQFNRKESYRKIKADIKQHLMSEVYCESIKKAEFRSFRGRLVVFAMKHKLMWLLYLLYLIKR